MQVRVAPQDSRTTRLSRAFRSPWAVAVLGLALALPAAAALVAAGPLTVNAPTLLAVFCAAIAAELINLQFEFRRQGFYSSAGELAFVIALVELGGTWTAVVRAGAVGIVLLVQHFPRPKIVYNVAVGVVETAVAVAIVSALSVENLASPTTWLSYLLAIFVGNVVAGLLIAAAITTTQGYPGRAFWASLFVPVLMVGPVAVLVGLAILLLIRTTPWAAVLIAPLSLALAMLYRHFATVTREGQSLGQVYDFARRVEQVA